MASSCRLHASYNRKRMGGNEEEGGRVEEEEAGVVKKKRIVYFDRSLFTALSRQVRMLYIFFCKKEYSSTHGTELPT